VAAKTGSDRIGTVETGTNSSFPPDVSLPRGGGLPPVCVHAALVEDHRRAADRLHGTHGRDRGGPVRQVCWDWHAKYAAMIGMWERSWPATSSTIPEVRALLAYQSAQLAARW